MTLSPVGWVALAALVFFAGFVDALAGGGGLITMPAYLAVGLPPALLLGTNKLSALIGTVVAAFRYSRALRLPLRPFLPAVAAGLVGSIVGARLVLLVDPRWLRPILFVAVPLVGYAVYSRHDFGSTDRSASLPDGSLKARTIAVSFPVGAYDGFFGPGAGTFYALGFARLARYDLLGATARAKLVNLATNLAALVVFLSAGRVALRLGLVMGAVSVGGNWAGSHLGLRGGSRAIRPAILLVCAGLIAKLLISP